MAVHHMVWLKFHDGVDAERIDDYMNRLNAMGEYIPAIVNVAASANFTDRARDFTHGLLVTVETRDDLPRYLQHPHHMDIVKTLKDDADVMAMDIEN